MDSPKSLNIAIFPGIMALDNCENFDSHVEFIVKRRRQNYLLLSLQPVRDINFEDLLG